MPSSLFLRFPSHSVVGPSTFTTCSITILSTHLYSIDVNHVLLVCLINFGTILARSIVCPLYGGFPFSLFFLAYLPGLDVHITVFFLFETLSHCAQPCM